MPVTPAPSSTISPVPSQPGIIGSGSFTPGMPRRTHRSRWLRLSAATLTSTSPAPGLGLGRSTIFRTDGSPCALTWTACIALAASASEEVRRAPFDEGRDALARVGRGEQARLELALQRESRLE